MADKHTVLIVEDHKLIQEALAMIVNLHNFEVLGTAKDGLEAVNLVKKLKPDVAIMDIEMPRLNGIEASRQIRAFDSEVKILVLTQHSESQTIHDALEAGVNGYILKKAGVKTLVEGLKAVLDGGEYYCDIVGNKIELYDLFNQHAPEPLSKLSEREREVFFAVIAGRTSKEAGEELGLSPKTIDTYRSRILNKLNLENIPALLRFAIQNNLMMID